jgi:hypothetical protein
MYPQRLSFPPLGAMYIPTYVDIASRARLGPARISLVPRTIRNER